MTPWTAEGFQESFAQWLEAEKPTDASQRRFLLWARRVALDPFDAAHAMPYPDVGPGWWFAAIPDVDERVIIVVYRVDDFYRVVTCSMVVFLDEDDDDDDPGDDPDPGPGDGHDAGGPRNGNGSG